MMENDDNYRKGSFKVNIQYETGLSGDRHDMLVYAMLLTNYPELTDEELKVCRIIIATMWDLHWEVALYDEVVARELPYEYFTIREELPNEILEHHKACYEKPEEVKEVIASLVAKGVFQDTEQEFLYGHEGCQTARIERVLRLVRKELYDDMNKMRVRLGMYYYRMKKSLFCYLIELGKAKPDIYHTWKRFAINMFEGEAN